MADIVLLASSQASGLQPRSGAEVGLNKLAFLLSEMIKTKIVF